MKPKTHAFSASTRAALAATDDINADIMKQAAAKIKAEADKAAIQRAEGILRMAESIKEKRLNDVRSIRKQEETALANLKVIDSALETFKKDGNFAALMKSTGLNAAQFGVY